MEGNRPQGKNPGLSPEAWIRLHRLLAAANIKYRKEIQEMKSKKAEEEKQNEKQQDN